MIIGVGEEKKFRNPRFYIGEIGLPLKLKRSYDVFFCIAEIRLSFKLLIFSESEKKLLIKHLLPYFTLIENSKCGVFTFLFSFHIINPDFPFYPKNKFE